MTWLFLAGAIACEVVGTVSLRLSDGFSKLVPTIIVIIGYLAAFVLLAQVLKRGMQVGIAYAIWAACGVALVSLAGAAFLGDRLTWVQVIGIALVIAGVLAIDMGAAH